MRAVKSENDSVGYGRMERNCRILTSSLAKITWKLVLIRESTVKIQEIFAFWPAKKLREVWLRWKMAIFTKKSPQRAKVFWWISEKKNNLKKEKSIKDVFKNFSYRNSKNISWNQSMRIWKQTICWKCVGKKCQNISWNLKYGFENLKLILQYFR